jgi:hypothetical protein
MGINRRMKRLHDWPERLHAYLESLRAAAFDWGSLDCCLMPANAVREMTGEDPAPMFRGKYHDLKGARRALRKYAGGDIEATIEKMAKDNGWPEISPLKAQRGDPVLVLDPAAPWPQSLGICGGTVALVMSENGLASVPMTRTMRAWRV